MRFNLSRRRSETVHQLLAGAKLPWLEWRVARSLASPMPRARIPFIPRRHDGGAPSHLTEVRKRDGRINAIAVDLDWARSRAGFSTLHRRLGIFVRLLSDRAVPDGDWWNDPCDEASVEGAILGFCTRWRETILVPDRGFVSTRGYERERRAGRAAPDFDDRDPAIVWRGGPTGIGDAFADPMHASSPALRQRVRLCLMLRDRPRSGTDAVDVRFARGRAVGPDLGARYEAAGILADFIPAQTWCRRRFAIDIDGNANAFSNLFIRLLYGCCVIRVTSPFGFRQWYHDRLEAGRHYVPVAADLSDLDAVIEWCRRHPADCREIARAGQKLVMDMTFAGEMRRTVESLSRRGPTAATPVAI
jgi:hypothetical protein